MIKTILPSSYAYQDKLASLVDVHSKGVDKSWMSKRAAAGIFKDADIKPVKGHSFIHLIAAGDEEFWGKNRNLDGYLEKSATIEVPHPERGRSRFIKIAKGHKETYKTFETHAKVYRNHKERDPSKALGDVTKAAHNDMMHRVELIIKVPDAMWSDELEKLASGQDVPFSQSCKVSHDVCSECGHHARTRKEYCDHTRNHLGEITKEGNLIGVVNDNMHYFDISKVVVGADRTAFGLLKAASDISRIVGGAELAEQLFPADAELDDSLLLDSPRLNKLAMIRKLSEIEKEIEATAHGDSPMHKCMMAFDPEVSGDIPEADIKPLTASRSHMSDVLGALADVKISLTIKDFLKILLGDKFSEVAEHVDEAKSMLPGMFSRLTKSPASTTSGFDDFDLSDGIIPRSMRETISKLVDGHSLDDEPVRRRVMTIVIRGKSPMKPAVPVDMEKKSGRASTLAERMALAYAMYKVAFCRRVDGADRALLERAVLQHYA